MKKFFVAFIALIAIFSFGSGIQTKAMNIFDESADPLETRGNTYDPTRYLASPSIVDASVAADGQLQGIQIELPSEVIIRGEEQTLRLIGHYSDGVRKTISPSEVEWTSTQTAVATLSSEKLKALAPGDTVLIARYGGQMDYVTIRVKDFKEQAHKVNVPTNKIWNVPFNRQIDIQTVDNITVLNSKGVEIPVTYNYLNDKKSSIVQVTADGGYTPGERYTIWVKDVRSLSGKSLKHYTKMDFTIKK